MFVWKHFVFSILLASSSLISTATALANPAVSNLVNTNKNNRAESHKIDDRKVKHSPRLRRRADPDYSLEWTALGDSYASGVGTTEYVDGLRCLRYDEAYPVVLNFNPDYAIGGDKVLPPGPHKFNNVVCSGAEADDIIKYQLLDDDTSGVPNSQYGSRPAFGSPEFATLTAGGDDIDFPGILFNCILGIALPAGGPTQRSCTDQRAFSRNILENGLKDDGYVRDLIRVIDAIMKKGRQGPSGNDFRLYVTGYARFFNEDTTGDETNCDGTTFQIGGVSGLYNRKPIGPDGAKDAYLTREIRKDFNEMSDMLNEGVARAVHEYNDDHVQFIDIQIDQTGRDILRGHRFCEPGVQEPDPYNKNLFFHHFPYYVEGKEDAPANTSATDPYGRIFVTAFNETAKAAGANIYQTYPKYNQFLNAVIDKLTPQLFQQNGISNHDDVNMWGGWLGYRTRLFHPRFAWNAVIVQRILLQYVLDHNEGPYTGQGPNGNGGPGKSPNSGQAPNGSSGPGNDQPVQSLEPPSASRGSGPDQPVQSLQPPNGISVAGPDDSVEILEPPNASSTHGSNAHFQSSEPPDTRGGRGPGDPFEPLKPLRGGEAKSRQRHRHADHRDS